MRDTHVFYTREKLIELNRENARAKVCPMFWSDHCCYCKADLVEYYGQSYATELITGCPVCFQSFID